MAGAYTKALANIYLPT